MGNSKLHPSQTKGMDIGVFLLLRYTLTIFGCCSSSRKNTCSCNSRRHARHNRDDRPCGASRACNSSPQSTQRCWIGTMRMLDIKILLRIICNCLVRHTKLLCYCVQTLTLDAAKLKELFLNRKEPSSTAPHRYQ